MESPSEVLRLMHGWSLDEWRLDWSDGDPYRISLRSGRDHYELRFDPMDLARALASDEQGPWGPDVRGAELVARLILVHLEEALFGAHRPTAEVWRYSRCRFMAAG